MRDSNDSRRRLHGAPENFRLAMTFAQGGRLKILNFMLAIVALMFALPAFSEWSGSNSSQLELVLFVAPDQSELNPAFSCGEIEVVMDVAENGAVVNPRIYSSNGDHLVDEVLRVAKLWKFKPEIIDGEPKAKYGVLIEVNFDCGSTESSASIVFDGTLDR